MKTEINDFIGIFDNVAPNEYCDLLINFFDQVQSMGQAVSRKKHEDGSSIDKDNSLYFYMGETDPLLVGQQYPQIRPFVEIIQNCYKLYVEKYGIIENLGRHLLNPDIKLQKTLPGEGYHTWHCEIDKISTARRFLLCMLYLNNIDEGGETEFLYQHKRIKPVKGRFVICPTAFTHTHRGNPPLNTAKYMINGWMEFIT